MLRAQTLPWSLLLGSTLALAACSGDDTPDAGPVDAGPVDTGVEVDAGPPDTGVQGPCNPVDGTGCIETDKFCVLQTSTDEGQCRELINPVGHEEVCSQQLQNCEAGFACLLLQGEDDPTCRKVCRVIGGEGCDGLSGSAAAYDCSLRLQGVRDYGFCAPAAEACDPLNNQCPMAENCGFIDQEGNTGCIPAGPRQLGQTCNMDACARGGICVTLTNVSDTPTCYEPCDLSNPTCMQANYVCGDIGAPFGLCVPDM